MGFYISRAYLYLAEHTLLHSERPGQCEKGRKAWGNLRKHQNFNVEKKIDNLKTLKNRGNVKQKF